MARNCVPNLQGEFQTLWESNQAYYEQVAHAAFSSALPEGEGEFRRSDMTLYEMEYSQVGPQKESHGLDCSKSPGKGLI